MELGCGLGEAAGASSSDHGSYFKSPFQSCVPNAFFLPPRPLLVVHYNTAAEE